jgi:hypothetical protein
MILVLSTGAPALQTQDLANSTEIEGLKGLKANNRPWDESAAEPWDRSTNKPWDGPTAEPWDRSAAEPWDGTFNSRSWQGSPPINGPLAEAFANTRPWEGLSANTRLWDGLFVNTRSWEGMPIPWQLECPTSPGGNQCNS